MIIPGSDMIIPDFTWSYLDQTWSYLTLHDHSWTRHDHTWLCMFIQSWTCKVRLTRHADQTWESYWLSCLVSKARPDHTWLFMFLPRPDMIIPDFACSYLDQTWSYLTLYVHTWTRHEHTWLYMIIAGPDMIIPNFACSYKVRYDHTK